MRPQAETEEKSPEPVKEATPEEKPAKDVESDQPAEVVIVEESKAVVASADDQLLEAENE